MEQQAPFSRRNPRPRARRPSTTTIPNVVSPVVKLIFSEMRRQNIRYDDVEDKSGVLRATLKAWRHRNTPSLDNLTAVLDVLGWDFIPVPRDRVLDPEVLAALKPAAERVGLDLGDAAQFAAEIAFGRPMPEPSRSLQ